MLLAGLSAWQGLFDRGALTQGQRVLIHGAAGGVGNFAVQLAHWRGAYVIGTASTANVDRVRALGVDEVIDHAQARFEDAAGSVNPCLRHHGRGTVRHSFAVRKAHGRIVSVAQEPPAPVGPRRSMRSILWCGRIVINWWSPKLADALDLRPVIDRVFSLAEAR